MLGWGEGVERVRQRRNKREKALGREIWKQRLRFASFLSYPPPPPPPPLSRLVFFPLSAPPRREHIAIGIDSAWDVVPLAFVRCINSSLNLHMKTAN